MIALGVSQKLLKAGAAVLASSVAFGGSSKAFSVMASSGNPAKAANIYGFSAVDIDGNEVSLDKYRGHVCVVVNVASQ